MDVPKLPELPAGQTLLELVEQQRAGHGHTASKIFAYCMTAETLFALICAFVLKNNVFLILVTYGAIAMPLSFMLSRRYAQGQSAAYLNTILQLLFAFSLGSCFDALAVTVLAAGSLCLSAMYRNVHVMLVANFLAIGACVLFVGASPPTHLLLLLALAVYLTSACYLKTESLWEEKSKLLAVWNSQSKPLPAVAASEGIRADSEPEPGTREKEEPNEGYAALVKNSSDAIMSHDMQGVITSWNLGAELLTGYDESGMKGQHINKLLSEDNRKVYWSKVAELRSYDRLPSFEVQIISKDEEMIYVSAMISEIRSTSGDTTNVSLIARDISRQKEAEAHVGDLYAMVSHELRTPLTSLRGSLTLLDEGMVKMDSEDGLAMLRIARQGTEKLLKIVNDILDVRKLEEGRMKLHREVIKVDDLIDQSILSVQSMADSRGVKLTKAVAEKSYISADRERMVQVLVNFLTNAVKHSTAGDEVLVQAVLRRSGNVRFSVVDNGPGIPEVKKLTLFQKFHYVGSSANASSLTGAGVGLAICRSIVQQHDGAIGLDSTEGQGSTFWFELKALGRNEKSSGTKSVASLKHVLLVSDNEASVQLLYKHLMGIGVGCRIARLEETLALAESVKPAVVFIDTNCAGSGLFDLIESINGSLPDVKTVIYRGSSAPDAGTYSHPAAVRVFPYEDQTGIATALRQSQGRTIALGEDGIAIEEADVRLAKSVSEVSERTDVTVISDLAFLVREKFCPIQSYEALPSNKLLLVRRRDMTPEDESYAILSVQQSVLGTTLSHDEFLAECASY